MNVEYFGHHFHITDELRRFAETKLKKVLKFLDEPIEIRVTVDASKHGIEAEVHATHRHGVLQGREHHSEVKDALNLVIDKIETQAERAKSKYFDKRRRADQVPAAAELDIEPIESPTA